MCRPYTLFRNPGYAILQLRVSVFVLSRLVLMYLFTEFHQLRIVTHTWRTNWRSPDSRCQPVSPLSDTSDTSKSLGRSRKVVTQGAWQFQRHFGWRVTCVKSNRLEFGKPDRMRRIKLITDRNISVYMQSFKIEHFLCKFFSREQNANQ